MNPTKLKKPILPWLTVKLNTLPKAEQAKVREVDEKVVKGKYGSWVFPRLLLKFK